jgi:hypothetical protein
MRQALALLSLIEWKAGRLALARKAGPKHLQNGLPDYNWSLATAIELLLERYKEPIP